MYVRYKLSQRIPGLKAACARHSVLPVFGRTDSSEALIRTCGRVIGKWRRLIAGLVELNNAGLPEARLYCAANCAPCGVYYRPSGGRTCHLGYMCPFCWGRAAAELYATVNNVFDLPVKYASEYYLIGYKAKLVKFCRPSRLPVLLERAKWHQYKLVRDLEGVVGAHTSITLEPLQNGSWKLLNRGLLISRKPYEPADFEPVSRLRHTVRVFQSPGSSEIARTISWALRYPKQLLMANASSVALFLNARKGRHLSATYGEFRRRLKITEDLSVG